MIFKNVNVSYMGGYFYYIIILHERINRKIFLNELLWYILSFKIVKYFHIFGKVAITVPRAPIYRSLKEGIQVLPIIPYSL